MIATAHRRLRFICATNVRRARGIRRFTFAESQDLVNQFSFWPRYDEFVEINAAEAANRERALTPRKAA